MKGHQEALRLLQEAELICDAECVQREVARVAREISAELGGQFPVVLSVMGGAAIFTGQLLPQLGFPLEFGAIEVTRYNNDIEGREITWRLPPRDNVRGRTVLVVDDILDEGITLAAIHKKLVEMGAKRVLSAVFADKDIGRAKPIKADLVGLTLPNEFVVGFGMDVYNYWRNLPGLWSISQADLSAAEPEPEFPVPDAKRLD